MAARCGPLTGRPSGPVGRGTAAALAEKNNDRFHEAELHRLRGEFLLRRQPAAEPAEAEACFRQAITVARREQTKSFELRAAVSLARLLQGQGRAAEGRELLAETYGRFTEGWESRDLREAKDLLDSLA